MSTRRIAVIGSNAFSGSDFIDLLLDDPGNEVIGISRSPEKSALYLAYKRRPDARVTFHQADLNRDADALLKVLDGAAPAFVVNFAAQSEVAPSWEHPEQWFQTNVVALARLANALNRRDYLQRYVHISSPEVYGSCTDAVTESAPLNPSTPYAASKAAADLFLATLFRQARFPVVTIRSTNVYGARQQLWKLIPRTIICLKKGTKVPLHGGGVSVKSYIHVRDVSAGERAVMERGRPGAIYHLSPDSAWVVRDVVRLICDMMGRDFAEATVLVEERLGQDTAYVIDSAPARTTLGWRPKVSMEEGIAEVIDWVERNWAEIEREPHEYVHRP